MTAKLWTKCGCSKEVNITYPPPPAIIVPLFRDIPWALPHMEALSDSSTAVRRFVLRNFWNGGPKNSAADYFEAA